MANHPNRHPPENRSAFLAAMLARALPDAAPVIIARAVAAMQHAAAAHKRWGEQTCSYPMTEAQTKRGDKRCAGLAEKAAQAMTACLTEGRRFRIVRDNPYPSVFAADTNDAGKFNMRLQLRFGGDPRGPCGWLVIDGQPGDWGEGWAIYGREQS